MGNSEQTMLLVSDDATLCATARREFEARITGLRVATVSSVAAARRILEGNSPAAILLEEGVADYVPRNGGNLLATLGPVQRRLEQAQKMAASTSDHLMQGEADFGEVLRHELNNPLTGILGNAELLLVEIHRKNDGRIPHGGEQRLETIAALAVRLSETALRPSQEWEARQHPAH